MYDRMPERSLPCPCAKINEIGLLVPQNPKKILASRGGLSVGSTKFPCPKRKPYFPAMTSFCYRSWEPDPQGRLVATVLVLEQMVAATAAAVVAAVLGAPV